MLPPDSYIDDIPHTLLSHTQVSDCKECQHLIVRKLCCCSGTLYQINLLHDTSQYWRSP